MGGLSGQVLPPELVVAPVVTETSIVFTVSDPDIGGQLNLGAPFKGAGSVLNGDPTTITPAAQSAVAQGELVVTDNTFIQSLGIGIAFGTNGGDAITVELTKPGNPPVPPGRRGPVMDVRDSTRWGPIKRLVEHLQEAA